MKLIYKDYRTEFVNDTYFNILVIENPNLLYRFNQDIYDQTNTDSDEIHISNDGKQLDFKKALEWIISPWSLNVSDRKTTTKLHEYLTSVILDKGKDIDILSYLQAIEVILADIIIEEPMISMNTDSASVNQMLKFFDVKFNFSEIDSFIEMLIDYILVKAQYENKRLFIFNQFLGFMKQEDIEELYNFSKREELTLLFVEGSYQYEAQPINGRLIVIDDDLCEIIINEG